MFETLISPESRAIVWLKRVFRVVIAALLAIGMVSSYRAYFQVWSLELSAPRVLSAGSVVRSEVVTSGRTAADVEVDLIQGTHSKRLIKLHLNGNDFGFFNPRSQHASDSITLTSETLSKFQTGPACLRSVATGRHQWMRLPPPTIRELEVEIMAP